MGNLNKEIISKIQSITGTDLKEKCYKAGNILFAEDEVIDSLYFVQHGLLKTSFTTIDGKEYIKRFIKEKQIIGPSSSLTAKLPAGFQLKCIEDSKIIKIKIDNLFELLASDHQLAVLSAKFALELASQKERRELFSFLSKSSEEQYDEFIRDNLDIVNRITQTDIAKYLGITNVALSRIRGRKIKNYFHS